MKKILLILLFFFVSFNTFAGGLENRGCPIKNFSNYKNCPNLLIGKVISDKHLLKLEDKSINYYILDDNYFIKNFNENKLLKTNYKIINETNQNLKVGDVILYNTNISNYTFLTDEEKYLKLKKQNNYLTNKKIIFNKLNKYYIIECNNNEFTLKNDYKLDKYTNNRIITFLKKSLKTCENYNNIFSKNKIYYKTLKIYPILKNAYKKILLEKYNDDIKKVKKSSKKIKNIKKLIEIRNNINNSKNYNKLKKQKINIILDALYELIK